MRKETIYFITSITLALILTATSIMFKNNEMYSQSLIILSIAIATLSSIYIILVFIFKSIKPTGMKIHLDSKGAYKYALDTYKKASQEGGEIIATHIFQQRVQIDKDMAYNTLEKSNSKIKYKRALIFSNKQEEKEWIERLFTLSNNGIQVTAYVWKNIDIIFKHAFVSLIPRFNFIIYKSLDKKEFRILIGFEKIRSRSNYFTKDLNIAFSFNSQHVHNAIEKYFTSIATHPEVLEITELSKYSEYAIDFQHTSNEQFVIKDLLDYTHTNSDIVHVGAFGKTATLLKNINKVRAKQNHLSDIDILLVAKKNIEEIKEDIRKRTSEYPFPVELIWGDDESKFYNYRENGCIQLDIELFAKDSNFYKCHQLLGYSIFNNYFNVYTEPSYSLQDIIYIPQAPTTIDKRKSLFLNNRKSISEFISKLQTDHSSQIDIRRVLTINIQNFNWVLTGTRSYDIEIATDYLHGEGYFSDYQHEIITKILDSETNETIRRHNTYREIVLELLQDIAQKLNTTPTTGHDAFEVSPAANKTLSEKGPSHL